MDIFARLAVNIIKEQESIIGPVALEQARKVPGLKLDFQKKEVAFDGNGKEILEKLVEQYKVIFGQASVEVCKDAVRNIISEVPKDQIPNSLQ